VVSFRITKGNVHDTTKFGALVKDSAERHDIDKVYGDKANDNRNVAFTRNVGRAKMYKSNPNSKAAKHLQQFVFDIATRSINNVLNNAETRQTKITLDAKEENVLENS
jgi:hypothetical protein